MAVELTDGEALRIAELLDLFAELPSTPPVLTGEAREIAGRLSEQLETGGHKRGFGHPPQQGAGTTPR